MSIALATIGHNSGTPAEIVAGIKEEMRLWLVDHPVLQSDDEAREAARLARRAKNTLDDIDADRKAKVGPLNAEVKAINATYADAVLPVSLSLGMVKDRMTAWAEAEELRRQEEAECARLEAIEKARIADEAFRAVREAEDNAAVGEATDTLGAALAASLADADAKRAERVFLRAEKAVPVRMAPGMGGRAMSLKSHTELSVIDPVAAIGELGLTEGIAEAILTAARAFKKLHSRLPAGIASNITRSV